jgi:hypothetical protein
MFFKSVPDVLYDQKPIRYPFSESDFVTAKNFFRRFKVNEDVFDYAFYFNQYAVKDQERLDILSEKFYGSSEYDWVIAISNNIINPLFDLPMNEYTFRKFGEDQYGEEEFYSGVHHYETYEVINDDGIVVLKEGIKVDEAFYNSNFKYYDAGEIKTISGNEVCRRVTNLEYESSKNEEKRKIYILKPRFLSAFVDDFETRNFYKKSNGYISKRLKQSGI